MKDLQKIEKVNNQFTKDENTTMRKRANGDIEISVPPSTMNKIIDEIIKPTAPFVAGAVITIVAVIVGKNLGNKS